MTETALSPGDHAQSADITQLPDVIKGKSDWRCYRSLRLPNGTAVVLVNDKESKTTAMSVCVNVGASADPRELSGLAHFTEHMCFLGSEKYPGENEYKRFLSQHGGRSNASTSMTYTTYKFDVLAGHAEGAIDIFSNFFVTPLFTESGTSREVNAVDSENSKNLTADSRRRLQILKALADPEHHWSKFSTGNALTLPAALKASDEEGEETQLSEEAKKVREALLAFHRRHYRPSNMTVVIVGPQPLDTLQEWVVPRFAGIIDRWSKKDDQTEIDRLIDAGANDAPANGFDHPAPPYNPAFDPKMQGGKWPVLLTTLPLRSMRKLVLMFPLPSVQKVPDRSPVSIISHLLGHEGPGSSFAVLQDAGLLNSLSAGSRISAPDQCLLQIDIGLTEQGEAQWKEVVAVLFEHCRLIASTAAAAKESADKESCPYYKSLAVIWKEVCQLNSMNFHQTSPGQAYDFAPRLAQSVVTHGVEKCISAGSMLDEGLETFPLEDLSECSSQLIPTNCIIERCSQGAWDSQKQSEEMKSESTNDWENFGLMEEKWYGVEYYLSDICAADVGRWEHNREFEEESAGVDPVNDEHASIGSVHLPRPNRYIPRSLELCPDLPEEAKAEPRIEKQIDPPKLILDDKVCGRLWHKLDARYALPKSSLILLLRNPAVENVQRPGAASFEYDIDTNMRSLLLTGMFSDALAQDTYDADLAGLYWSLSKSPSGITLSCSGYSDRLPDLAQKLLRDFLIPTSSDGDTFMKESHFSAVKDRTLRSLKSYFQSRRADSHAMYYRDLFMSSKGEGIEKSIAAAEAATLDSIIEHHTTILQNSMGFECLFSGNVSELEARSFFNDACNILRQVTVSAGNGMEQTNADGVKANWFPGPYERRLELGEDVGIHFASKNPEEENGAVLVTYQSHVPGFRGTHLSSKESLKYTAAIRVLCHMLREPLFDELRTKQQLGYIVSSYYDIGFSTRLPNWEDQSSDPNAPSFLPSTTPIDFIVVNILSRKLSPPEVTSRLDEFLASFRDMLGTMPESEIRDHADALSKKLLKPIQKLGTEVGMHYGKIRRYAPEVLHSGGKGGDLPWDSVKDLAREVEGMQREDLLEVWNSVVAGKSRSRVTSCVYGSTFPLGRMGESLSGPVGARSAHLVKSMDDILKKREELIPYDADTRAKERGFLNGIVRRLGGKRNAGMAAVALIGIGGAVGLSMISRADKERNTKK
mmetsp:Transcript_39917/g.120179  ORF Transcript_39917/g.120179 Transcript_39917/m.120179 type:complete len:1210 (-) Transcript_39917:47-3676(-)